MRSATQGSVALVPTMGAFHEGHLSLMRTARKDSDTLVVSLFVNPTQFGPSEDYTRYPRNEERDFALAEEAGVDVLFAPSKEEMYPSESTTVSVKGISQIWEGAIRPGHFDGVATVVCKLFNIIRPNSSFFGLKDLQQCAVIRRFVEDLNVPVALRFCPIVREPDGLAMSSRNAYLSSEERRISPYIYGELQRCAQAFSKRSFDEQSAQQELEASQEKLKRAGMTIDYFEVVDKEDLARKLIPSQGDFIIAAVRLGSTRLIDNIQI